LNITSYEQQNAIPQIQPCRVVERKIGNATFIVSSRFNENKEKDITDVQKSGAAIEAASTAIDTDDKEEDEE